MPVLTHLTLTHFRNLTSLSLSPAPGINLILGENGSGKTSILEAIYLLSHGRSFRSRSLKHLIQYEQSQLQLFGRLDEALPIGMLFHETNGIQIRFNNAPIKRLSELASQMPVQFVHANCHHFFELGPRYRRKLVDWGLFHVEHSFNYHWQNYRRLLQQRNAAIRQHKAKAEVELWNAHLSEHGEFIDKVRKQYLLSMLDVFTEIFAELCPDYAESNFTLRYLSGWHGEENLRETLDGLYERDIALGYTRSGPHAADWSIRINKTDPKDTLSRGQQKLFYLAIVFAQIKILTTNTTQKSILLIDDLTSELDERHQKTVLSLLQKLPVQAFISSTKMQLGEYIDQQKNKMFHVEQMVFDQVKN